MIENNHSRDKLDKIERIYRRLREQEKELYPQIIDILEKNLNA